MNDKQLETLALQLIKFLVPFVEKRTQAALRLDFVPRSATHLDFVHRRGLMHPERCMMAFFRADADVEALGEMYDRMVSTDGPDYVVNGGTPDETIFSEDFLLIYFAVRTSFHILQAWLGQLNASCKKRTKSKAVPLMMSMLDAAMLPPETNAFKVYLKKIDYDEAAVIAVLTEAKVSLQKGMLVPDGVERAFFPTKKGPMSN